MTLTGRRFANRLVAARADLAAAHLEGEVSAARFVAGAPRQVGAAILDLTLSPEPGAGLATQLLFGERFTVYETRADGLSWGQSEIDGYVGYVRSDGLGPAVAGTQPVTALASHIYSRPSLKARALGELSYLSRVAVAGDADGYLRLAAGGYVPAAHLAPTRGDFVDQAVRLTGAPYLWGGRSPRGLDCSALLQLALLAVGTAAPRDSDMQEALGDPLGPEAAPLRGDLVFWKGHVGVLTDPETLLHANAHHMAVAAEPLAQATARIEAAGDGRVTARRRLAPLPCA